MLDFTPSIPFTPRGLLKHPHIQTIRGNWRSMEGIDYTRHRLETPDDDFIDLDEPTVHSFESVAADANTPVVLLLHGLGGSARRGYMAEMYRQLAAANIRAIGMNYRGASEEINRQPRTYHSGAIDDIDFVLKWLRNRYPNVPLGTAGISIGGIMSLNLLGQRHVDVQAAVMISPAFDLASSAARLVTTVYNSYLLRKLRETVRLKAHQIGHLVDVPAILSAKTLIEFDDLCTAPLNGFNGAPDYYEKCSPVRYVDQIKTPTLVIRAIDDPFLDPQDIPYQALADNPYITPFITPHGGHVGFGQDSLIRPTWWSHQQAVRFFQHQFQIKMPSST